MYITIILTIARKCNKPSCTLIHEWIMKIWYIHKMEHYLALKKKEIMKFSGKTVDLGIIILSEVPQIQKDKNICSPSYEDPNL